jgi:hypothetical protein
MIAKTLSKKRIIKMRTMVSFLLFALLLKERIEKLGRKVYNTLLEIKEVRNALLHEGGHVSPDFFERFPKVPQRDNLIIIDQTYGRKADLVFLGMAYKIADSVVHQRYHAD